MKELVFGMLLMAGQMNTLQDKPVVRLQPDQDVISVEFGGDLVELQNAPPTVRLPPLRLLDSHGRPWAITVRNLGPGTVTVVGEPQVSVQIPVGKTVTIMATSKGYSAGH